MAIRSYANKAAYDAAAKSTIESQVSMIETTREIIIDGVNVVTTSPVVGDACFLNEANEIVFLKGGAAISKALVPSAWTFVGAVGLRKGADVWIINKGYADVKYANVSQFAWTDAVLDGSQHTKTIGLRFGIPNWDTTTTFTVTYTATTLAEAAAAATSAIEAKLAELGASEATIAQWWAYADEENNRVIIQRDALTDYRFYDCSGVTNILWGDMPASSALMRKTGRSTYYAPLMVGRAVSYYGTSGSTPTAPWPVNSEGIVTRAAFESSEYCEELRAAYGTYEDYIAGAMVRWPMKYGVFRIAKGEELGAKYGNASAPTKSGGTMFKFPALHHGAAIAYNNPALAAGKFHLMDVEEAQQMLVDGPRQLISATMTKMGAAAINNSTNRWFAERYNVYDAWFFYGTYGTLYISSYVGNGYRAQGVAHYKL